MGDFSGAFFSGRPLPAKPLGAFARAAVPDGVLSGCDLSFTGATLTVAAGILIACGRVFTLPESKQIVLSDATSGYARVIVQIDLTATNTETDFDQVSFVVQYASAADGFAALTQDDINVAGVVYQIELCVAALSASGIDALTVSVPTALAEAGRMPVGAIYLSVSDQSPASLFGGTWERIKDTFLLAAGDSYAAGATGGEAEHTLTIDEMPNHNHAVYSKYQASTTGTSSDRVALADGSGYDWTGWGQIAARGGDTAHNNMPPYLTVYVWKRVS